MTNKIEELKIGKSALFAIIHFCVLIMCIFIMWIITYPIFKEFNIIMEMLMILISGIAGIAIWMCLIPLLRQVENDIILLDKEKLKHGKHRKD